MYDEFETAETGFVQKLLRPGITVLDVGAHHGLYTLLASRRVGRNGRVIAFEASPRECRRCAIGGRHVRAWCQPHTHDERSRFRPIQGLIALHPSRI
jgi:hypothetical protein